MTDKPPALAAQLVQEFVIKCHGDLDRAKELLAQEPALLNASWDWGAGDWETGLGGAAHMGRKDIAEFLLSHGARLDIFAAAMLDQLEIVKAIIAVQPQAGTAPGPHGIPLLVHAQMGQAQRVLDYLATL
jgi:hypothetical protein